MKVFRDLMFWMSCPHYTSLQIEGVRWDCASKVALGIDEVLEWQNWAERESTSDQKRIEKFLSSRKLEGKSLLHVGVGNSEFARIFGRETGAVDGITIQNQEYKKGRDLGIANYRVFLLNKFSVEMPIILETDYDYIIDNNPTSFACCRKHFYLMMKSYLKLLRPGGVILTDKQGLNWCTPSNDPRWRLSGEEWFAVGQRFKLKGIRYNDSVFGLKKTG